MVGPAGIPVIGLTRTRGPVWRGGKLMRLLGWMDRGMIGPVPGLSHQNLATIDVQGVPGDPACKG